MSVRTSQRLIAASFIIGTSAIIILFVRLFSWASIILPSSIPIAIGVLGWIVMISACAVVIAHPKPEETLLGRFALMKEPLLRGDSVDRKRKILTLAVVGLAFASVAVSTVFFTDTVYAFFDKYLLGG